MVDRRKQQKELNPELKDDVFMYEPPADCGSVPKAAVPEWFVSSSRQCLLPGLDYDEVIEANKEKAKKVAETGDDDKQDGDEKEDENAPPSRDDKAQKDPTKYFDIGAHKSCKSSLMTFSFHVKSENVI